jgi:hypothetical protein
MTSAPRRQQQQNNLLPEARRARLTTRTGSLLTEQEKPR